MKLIVFSILTSFLISCGTQQLATIKLNGKFGCINKRGDIVIQPKWDYIQQDRKSNIILVRKDSLYGFIDKKDRITINPQYKEADIFSEGLAPVSNGNKYGFINTKGDTIIPFIYDDVFMGFMNGLSDVTINDSSGYINKSGEIVIPLIYDICYPFMSQYAQVETFDNRSLLVDKRGKTHEYQEIDKNIKLWRPRESYPGSFTTNTGQGRINESQDTVVPPIYLVTGNLTNGMYIVQDKNGKWGAYNSKGELAIKPQFESISHFKEGIASFKLNGKWGFINKKGVIVIPAIYEEVGIFSNGLAYIEIDKKAGFINKKGKVVIKPIFEQNQFSSFF